VERKKKRVRRHQRGYALAAVLAIIVVAVLAWFGTSRGGDPASIGAANISTSTISTTATTAGDGATSSTATTAAGDTSSTDGSGGATTTTSEAGATVSSSLDATTVTDSEAVTTSQLTMVATVTTGTCWLVVREDSVNGAEVYAGTLSAGGKQTFEGANRYWLNVGEPEHLVVSVGGKSYSLAAPAGAFVVTEAGVERSP
jgi:hypothetical protein